jgi:hypothetical protein
MTASDNLSPRQFTQLPMFMTPDEVSGLRSADYDMRPMHEVGQVMRDRYDHEQRRDAARGYAWSGSPLDHMAKQVESDGGIHTPARVVHLPTGYTALYDGHHRAVTALEQNRLLPVTHYTDHDTARDEIYAENDAKYWAGVDPAERPEHLR